MKKILSILLISAMLAGTFAACADNKGAADSSSAGSESTASSEVSSKDSSSDESEPESSAAETEKTPADSSAAEPGQLPIVTEPYTLNIFFQQETQVLDYEDNKLTKFLEEETGIHIEWNLVPGKDKTQKLNLLLATGQDLPDVFMGGMETATVIEYAEQGTIIPLTSYIENDSKWFKEVLGEIPDLEGIITAPDGEIYALPSVKM